MKKLSYSELFNAVLIRDFEEGEIMKSATRTRKERRGASFISPDKRTARQKKLAEEYQQATAKAKK